MYTIKSFIEITFLPSKKPCRTIELKHPPFCTAYAMHLYAPVSPVLESFAG
jgi:hypothetical protein